MLGPDAVLTAVLGGGRDPADRVRYVPWRDERTPARPDAPWPGRLPSPAPASVLTEPLPATVLAADGSPVGVTGRYAVSAPPARAAVGTGPLRAVLAWAGPWPVEERWWDAVTARRRARFQMLVAGDGGRPGGAGPGGEAAAGTALLLVLAGGRWWVQAIYD
jgi:protein ImuB